jgi:uncharacterized membrane protein YfcA
LPPEDVGDPVHGFFAGDLRRAHGTNITERSVSVRAAPRPVREEAVTHLDLAVLGIVLVATLIRSALGFGEALVAVPLLSLLIPVQVAAPLAVLVSITVAAIAMLQDWREVHARSAGWLVAATLAGIPIGLSFLTALDEHVVKGVLATVILAFAVSSLAGRTRFVLEKDDVRWLLGCGFVAGILGGAYGMNGPPLVVYGSLRRWSAAQFRATLQAYFLPASTLGMAGYWLAGFWSPAVTRYFLMSLPVTLLATFAGRLINRRLGERSFRTYVCVALVAVALALFRQAIPAAA